MNMNKEVFLSTFFDRLNHEAVGYFVFGSYLSLPKDTSGSDIDLIVDEADLNVVEKILAEITNHACGCRVSYYTNANTKFFRYLFYPQKFGIQIDVFYRGLYYRGVEYYPIKMMQDRIIEYNGIKVLDIHKGYYIDFLKEILHLGKARDKYLYAFVDEINNNIEYYRHELAELYGTQFAELVFSHLSKTELPNVYKQLQATMKSKILKKKRLKSLLAELSLLTRLFKKRPGYIIAVEGTDGSGKSFIIDQATRILNETFHNGIIYNHLRPNAFPDLGVVLGKKKKQASPSICKSPHGKKQSGCIGSLIRWGYYMIDYTFGYLMKVWPQIHTKSKVFIFDRYYYDYYIDQKRLCVNLPYWILRLGECFVPNPDLILCLGGNADIIYARKPETTLNEVRRQTKELKNFCDRRRNAVWIDTTVAPEESIDSAISAIYRMMREHVGNK